MDLRQLDEHSAPIFSQLLSEIKPTDEEVKRTTENVNALIRIFKEVVPKNVELKIAGSIARGTNLRGDADIDLFMLFDKGTSKEKLVAQGIEYGKKVAKKENARFEIKYAEHPYLRLYLEEMGVKTDVVPALKIRSADEMVTMVDRTPLHTEFINSHLNAKQRDHVRLLKCLLKAHDIYGAEVKIAGFPGYLCELLIYHYDTLPKLLKNVASTRLPLILDPTNKVRIEDEKIAKRFNSRFIVIDPVDKERNVAAGVSIESLGRFVLAARRFTEKPDISLFRNYTRSSDRKYLTKFLKNSGLDIHLIVKNLPDKSEDTTWPQLRKIGDLIVDQARRFGFETTFVIPYIVGEKGVILIAAPKQSRKSRALKGPSIFMEKATAQFTDAHKNSLGFIVSDESIYALDTNPYEKLEDLLADVIKGRLVSARTDVDVKYARHFMNKVPKEIETATSIEISKKLRIP